MSPTLGPMTRRYCPPPRGLGQGRTVPHPGAFPARSRGSSLITCSALAVQLAYCAARHCRKGSKTMRQSMPRYHTLWSYRLTKLAATPQNRNQQQNCQAIFLCFLLLHSAESFCRSIFTESVKRLIPRLPVGSSLLANHCCRKTLELIFVRDLKNPINSCFPLPVPNPNPKVLSSHAPPSS